MNSVQNPILLVEDETKLSKLLAEYLIASGFQPVCIDDGAQVVEAVHQHQPRLILLDLMLPNKDGISLCREIRQFSQVPIIMLTAKVDELDRLLGLELGADDYICKPFSPREVVARVKAVLRRSSLSSDNSSSIKVGQGWQLDEDRLQLRLDKELVQLTVIEYQLLNQLCSAPGRILSRSYLMEVIYQDNRIVSERTIDSHIKKLRNKILTIQPGFDCIHSVYGMGYRFEIISNT